MDYVYIPCFLYIHLSFNLLFIVSFERLPKKNLITPTVICHSIFIDIKSVFEHLKLLKSDHDELEALFAIHGHPNGNYLRPFKS